MLKLICRVTFFLFLMLFVYGENDELEISPRLGESYILKIFEEFKNRMCHEIPKFKLPRLEPFKLEHFDFSLDNSLAQLNGSVSGVQVDGLSDVNIEKLKLSFSLSFSFTVVIPKVSVNGNFQAKGILGELFPVDGKGKFGLTVKGIKLEASGRLTYEDTLFINKLKAKPSITDLEANIENLAPHEDVNKFINRALNQHGPELLDAVWEEVEKDVLAEVQEFSKILLKGLTATEILKIIRSEKPIFDKDDPEPNCKNKK